MPRLTGVAALLFLLLTLLPSYAAACGEDGERPCGGDCEWIVKGICPFCIPWCVRNPTSCHAGNAERTEYAFLLTGEVVETRICRRTSTPPPATVTVSQALASGCRSLGEVSQLLDTTLNRNDLGTATRSRLSTFPVRAEWVTRSDVTDPNTWGYRSPTIAGEMGSLLAGRLTSKAEQRISAYPPASPDAVDFWNRYGPQVDPASRDATSLSLQMIATATSYDPPSQFVSVALSAEVAERFGNGTYVYKFQFNPRSPVLGLRECQLEGGEVQLQPPAGTLIRNLRRLNIVNGQWERLQGGHWLNMGKVDTEAPEPAAAP